MNCKYCNKVLSGKSQKLFCSISCAAKLNNPGKNKKQGRCKACSIPIIKKNVYCPSCRPIRIRKTKEQIAEYMRNYYMTHSEQHRKHMELVNRRKERLLAPIRALLYEFKTSGCAICGETDASCLDAHHIDPNKKLFNLSNLRVARKLNEYIEEISKCVCLCSNCHRKLHAGKVSLVSNQSP